jgi:hypothetical protein
MNLVRLIYVSVMTEECDTEALQKILEVSRKKNTARKITGVLCYDPSYFLQCLEGPRDSVNDLYAEIVRDPRHRYVTLLEYTTVTEREFGSWSMAFMHTGTLDKNLFQKYARAGHFDPFELASGEANSLLLELVTAQGDKGMARQR